MDGILLASTALTTLAASGGTFFVIHRAARAAFERQLGALRDELSRERASARRRAEAAHEELKLARERTRTAVGLPPEALEPTRGQRLASAVVARVRGLTGVDHVSVVDEAGLAWAGEGTEQGASYAAVGGAALSSARTSGLAVREVHIELADARHIVVRPLAGTVPALALVATSVSRPVTSYALDSTVAFAALALGVEDSLRPHSDPLTGPGLRGTAADGSVARELERELAQARAATAARTLLITVEGNVLAGSSDEGPDLARSQQITAALCQLSASIERRLGVAPHRIDLTTACASTATLAPLVKSGRFQLFAIAPEGTVDTAIVDRLVGRIRRLMPAKPTLDALQMGAM